MSSWLDLFGELERLSRPADHTVKPSSLPEVVAKIALSPIAGFRGLNDAGQAVGQTAAGILPPSAVAPLAPLAVISDLATGGTQGHNTGLFLQDLARQGPQGALESARQRFEHAPEAIPGAKFSQEMALNPTAYLGARVPAGLVAEGLGEAPAIGGLLRGAARGEAAYDDAIRGGLEVAGKVLKGGINKIPGGEHALAQSQRSLGAAFDTTLTNVQRGASELADELGIKGQGLRAMYSDPPLVPPFEGLPPRASVPESPPTPSAGLPRETPPAAPPESAPSVPLTEMPPTSPTVAPEPKALQPLVDALTEKPADPRATDISWWLNRAQQDRRDLNGVLKQHGLPAYEKGQDIPLTDAFAAYSEKTGITPEQADTALNYLNEVVIPAQGGVRGGELLTVNSKFAKRQSAMTGDLRAEADTTGQLKDAWRRLEEAQPGAMPEEMMRAAQLRLVQKRYGDVYPGTQGTEHEMAAVETWLQRLQGEGAPTPTPAATEAGIPMGRARIDPTKLQEGLDAGLTRNEAMDRARVSIDMGEAAPVASAPSAPTAAEAAPVPPVADPLAVPPSPAGPAPTPPVPDVEGQLRPPLPAEALDPAALEAQQLERRAQELAQAQAVAAPAEAPRLSANLQKATPNYGYGNKLYQLAFESDVDKALYIVAQDAKRSAKDGDYLAYLQELRPDLDEAAIRAAGQELRNGVIKPLAKDGKGGRLGIPASSDFWQPPEPVDPTTLSRAYEVARAEQADAQKAARLARGEQADIDEVLAAKQRAAEAAQTVRGIEGQAADATKPPPTPPAPPVDQFADAREQLQALSVVQDARFHEQAKPVVQAAIKTYDKDREALGALADAFQVPEGQTMRDVVDAGLKANPTDAALLQARDLLSKYHGIDPLHATEDEAVRALAVNRYARDILRINPEDHGNRWTAVMGLWKQQALLAPSYHITNALDAMLKSLIYMGKPGFTDATLNPKALVDIWKRAANNGAAPLGASAAMQAEARGFTSLPSQVARTAQTATEIGAGRGFERVPGRVGTLFRFNRHLGEAIETSARTAAFFHGFDQYAAQHVEDLAGVAPEVAEALRASHGIMKPEEFTQIMREAGATDEALREGLRAYGRFRAEAYQSGIDFSNKIHFDYSAKTNADEWASNVLAFHIYSSRNIPAYLEILGTHPALYQGLREYDQYTDAENKAEGMSPQNKRFEHSVSLGGAGRAVASLIFGRNGEAFFNPLKYISIAQQLMEQPNEVRGQSALGSTVSGLRQLGFGLTPAANIGLTIAGQMGSVQPQPILRAEPIVTGALGAALGRPVETPWNALQRARPFGGAAPSDMALPVRMRLAEMAVERGRQNAPEFIQAMRPGGEKTELWQEAARAVMADQMKLRMGAFLGVPGLNSQFRPDTQRDIEYATAGIPQVNAEGGRTPLEPILPRDNAKPGQPLVTGRMRDALIAATGNPLGHAYDEARKPLAGEAGSTGGPGMLQARREAVLREYATASTARQRQMLADPIDGRFILEHQIKGIRLGQPGRATIDAAYR